ncbi:MAG: hypothetical protein JW900_10140 [Anaerolineae bacterium]|nr:hypothetical protein [Anaerolineae bacterium]
MLKPTLTTRLRRFWRQLDKRIKIGAAAVLALLVLAGCIWAGVAMASRLVTTIRDRAAAEPTLTSTAAAPTEAVETAEPPTPTPLPTLPPTETPAPSTEEPPPEPTPVPVSDGRGDVGTYGGGAPVGEVPGGIDIRTASVGPGRQVDVESVAGAPSALAGWVQEGETLLWIELYEPIPDPPTFYVEWLFALDVDGNAETGRPVGSARINPDIGMEAAVGFYYDPAGGAYNAYFLVWDPAQGGLVRRTAPRFVVDESRTVIGLALPLADLVQAISETTGVTLVPEAVQGRAAALARVGNEQVIDFYPDRPD